MSSRRFILFFTGIFCLGALPVLIAQPSGAASAGLSAGFVMPMEHSAYLLFSAALGLLAALTGRDAPVCVSSAMLAGLVCGYLLGLDHVLYPAVPYIILGALLFMLLLAGLFHRRAEMMGLLLAASLGFQTGWHSLDALPEIASPLYFMVGLMLSVSLIIAVSVSLGLTLCSEDWALGRALRESPKLEWLRRIFA